MKISKSTNKSRYNKNLEVPSQKTIDNFFRLHQTPLLNTSSRQSHTKLVQEFLRSKGSRYGFNVYVYKNDEFVGHFISYRKAQLALNIKSNKTISRLIDTNKISKIGGYKFYSKKL